MNQKIKLIRQALSVVSSQETLNPGDVRMVFLAMLNLLAEIVRELEQRDKGKRL